jgi:hypothetical protein
MVQLAGTTNTNPRRNQSLVDNSHFLLPLVFSAEGAA